MAGIIKSGEGVCEQRFVGKLEEMREWMEENKKGVRTIIGGTLMPELGKMEGEQED